MVRSFTVLSFAFIVFFAPPAQAASKFLCTAHCANGMWQTSLVQAVDKDIHLAFSKLLRTCTVHPIIGWNTNLVWNNVSQTDLTYDYVSDLRVSPNEVTRATERNACIDIGD